MNEHSADVQRTEPTADQPEGTLGPNHKRRFPFGLLFSALLVAGLAWAVFNGDPGRVESPLVGKAAPEFTSTRLETFTLEAFPQQISLTALRGRPVAVNFWASWCIPCRDEAPLLVVAQRKYAKDGFVMIGVSFNDRAQDAIDFSKEFGYNFPLVTDPKGTIAVDYGVTGIPETYFINRDGQVVKKHIGPFGTQQELDALIEDIR